VKFVVADSFHDIVLDKNKIVFLDVFADWCPPCVQVKPHILRMADVLHELKVSNISIAKMNSDFNDTDRTYLPETTIPNLKLFVKGKPINYTGGRTSQEMLKFIHQHAKANGLEFDLETALKREAVVREEAERKEAANKVTLDFCLQNGICTFSATARDYAPQSYWFCETCNKPDMGVCKSCKDKCHKDHVMGEEKQGPFYCDCGDRAYDKPCSCLKEKKTDETLGIEKLNV